MIGHSEPNTHLLLLNGIHFRPEDEWRDWLEERKAIGIGSIGVSLSGNREIHDRAVGRRGEFGFLCKAMHFAAELGLTRQEKLFLTRGTLPHLPALIDKLETIPGKFSRQISLLTYSGWARQLESDRITQKEYDGLPERIREHLIGGNEHPWRSEKEWITRMIDGEQIPSVGEGFLRLDVNEETVDRLLEQSCDEIFFDLQQRTDKAYSAMPDLSFLRKEYGELENTKMYLSHLDLRKKWLDRYFAVHPAVPDAHLVTWI
jgi:hypothetical protein